MLQALLVIAGLGAWAVAAWGGAGPQDVAPIAVSVLLALLIALRLGWLGRDAAILPRALTALARTPARIRAKTAGAWQVAQAAVSADVTIKPALVKLPLTDPEAASRATAAGALSEAPGAFVVALAPDAVLVHVLNEDAQKEDRLAARAGIRRRRFPAPGADA